MKTSLYLWAPAMGRHLWHIAKGQPAFDELRRPRLVFWSFFVCFLAAGLLRWSAVGDYGAGVATLGLILHCLALAAVLHVTVRFRSVIVLSVLLGVSTVVDLLGTTVMVTGLDSFLDGSTLSILEGAGYACVLWRYHRFLRKTAPSPAIARYI